MNTKNLMKSLSLVLATTCMGVTQAQAFGGDSTNGRDVYERRCSVCHGADGSGRNGMAADFRKEWHRLAKSDEELARVLREGFSTPGRTYTAGVCPPQALSDREMNDVLAYLRSAFLE